VTAVERRRRAGGEREHALLSNRRRDSAAAAAITVVTALFFVIMAFRNRLTFIRWIDGQWLRLMVEGRDGFLTSIAKVFDVLGRVYITLPVRIAVAGFLAWKRRWWHFAAFVSAMVVSELLISTLKNVYDRPRPSAHLALVGVSGASLPSGHAVAASVTVVAIVIALFPDGPRRFWWGVGAALFSFVMGLSRTYLGAHWLSDAAGGTLLGVAVALDCALVVQEIWDIRDHRARIRATRSGPAGPPRGASEAPGTPVPGG
jgi:undecaprenyl-diphosphatase